MLSADSSERKNTPLRLPYPHFSVLVPWDLSKELKVRRSSSQFLCEVYILFLQSTTVYLDLVSYNFYFTISSIYFHQVFAYELLTAISRKVTDYYPEKYRQNLENIDKILQRIKKPISIAF